MKKKKRLSDTEIKDKIKNDLIDNNKKYNTKIS